MCARAGWFDVCEHTTHVDGFWVTEYIRSVNRKLDLDAGLVEFWNRSYYLQGKRDTSVTVYYSHRLVWHRYIINCMETSLRIEAYLQL